MYTYVQVCTQLQNVFASTRKIAKTARLANLRIHCDFPLFSLSFAKFARIARNHRVGDFSRYLGFLHFFLPCWRQIRNPVADFTKFAQLKLRKIAKQTIFAVLAIFAILFHVNDYKVESQLQTIFRS